MSGKVAFPGTMMSDFRTWDQDHLNWLTEIQGWRTDFNEAQEALEAIQQRLLEHGRVLDQLSRNIAVHQQGMRDSSREIDEYQRSDIDVSEVSRSSKRAVHARQMEVHEATKARLHAMKKRHSQIMAQLASFMCATGFSDAAAE